jgi:hypothetical protein
MTGMAATAYYATTVTDPTPFVVRDRLWCLPDPLRVVGTPRESNATTWAR